MKRMKMVEGRRRKARNRANEEEEEQMEEDRLSNLPESLLHHIFSSIDTKFAVRTTALSTRWRHFWTSLPNLNFNCDSFLRLTSFHKFVSRVLSRCDGSNHISTLNFYGRANVQPWLLKKVIIFALSHNLQEISIDVFFPRKCIVPLLTQLFNRPSLKTLKLNTLFPSQSLPKSFNLPAITTLHLYDISFSAGGSKCLDLFSRCSNLKNLSLTNFVTWDLEVFNIVSPQLANLTILFTLASPSVCKIVVSAPKLTFLHLEVYPYLYLSVENLSSLEHIQVDAYSINHLSPIRRLMQVFRELCNAKYVTLFWNVIEVLSRVPDLLKHQPPPFVDLKSLKLKHVKPNESTVPDHVMVYLFNCSPNATVTKEFLKIKGRC